MSSEIMKNNFDLRSFSSDVIIYAAGRGFILLLGFTQTVILSRYLSLEGYGYWQLFMLYASYVGILHLGLIDGVLLRWAGKNLNQISNEIKKAFIFLLFEQIIIILPIVLVLYFYLYSHLRWICLMLLAYSFIINLETFFIFITQAIRKFRLLTVLTVIRSIGLIIVIILLTILEHLDYQSVVVASVITYVIILLTFVFIFRGYLFDRRPSLSSVWAFGKGAIKIGVFVLFGNFILVLFTTIDRLMVSSFFTLSQFAIYAFALTITMVAYTFIVAVSQVFFPYLSASMDELRIKAIRLGKPAIILSWATSLILYFPLVMFVEFFLPHYVDSLPIMQVLLCTVGLGAIIQILHVNYYKTYRKQKQYFIIGAIALTLSIILNLLAINIWGTLLSIAVATLFSFCVWYIANEISLRTVVGRENHKLGKDLLIFSGYISSFWISSLSSDWPLLQMIVYISCLSLFSWLLLRKEARELIILSKNFLKRQPSNK